MFLIDNPLTPVVPSETCPNCGGNGQQRDDDCNTCGGTGSI